MLDLLDAVVVTLLEVVDVLVVDAVPGCVLVTETAVLPTVTTAVKAPGTLNLPIPESQQSVV